MPTVGCQLDRGSEAPAPSQGSAPVAARLSRPVGLWLLPRVGASGCVSGRLGALGKGSACHSLRGLESSSVQLRGSRQPPLPVPPALAPRPHLSMAVQAPAGDMATPVHTAARTSHLSPQPGSPQSAACAPFRSPAASPLLPGFLSSAADPAPPLGGLRPGPAGSAEPGGGGGGDSGCHWPPSGAAARAPRRFPCPATPRLHSCPFPCPRGPAQWRGRYSLGLRSSGCKAQLLLAEIWEKRPPTLSMLLSPPSVFLPQCSHSVPVSQTRQRMVSVASAWQIPSWGLRCLLDLMGQYKPLTPIGTLRARYCPEPYEVTTEPQVGNHSNSVAECRGAANSRLIACFTVGFLLDICPGAGSYGKSILSLCKTI
ncbi:uncharacterized protein LOC141576325 [Camelus bactrianus]|uniref:Uncharacterized protein LOC141576325 n=1 Tax=Camelus bactrianus TaxID=9837 RepID=A0AC58PZA2_CAMBA